MSEGQAEQHLPQISLESTFTHAASKMCNKTIELSDINRDGDPVGDRDINRVGDSEKKSPLLNAECGSEAVALSQNGGTNDSLANILQKISIQDNSPARLEEQTFLQKDADKSSTNLLVIGGLASNCSSISFRAQGTSSQRNDTPRPRQPTNNENSQNTPETHPTAD